MVKITDRVLSCAFGLITLAAVSFAQINVGSAQGEILAARKTWNKAMAEHDAEALSGLMMPSFQSVNAAGERRGMTAAKNFYASLFKRRPDLVWVRKPARVVVNERLNVASEEGSWTERWTEKDGMTELRGSYFVFWRRVNGKWKEQADLFVPETCKGRAYCEPNVPRIISESPEDLLNRYTGWYHMSDGSVLEVKREGAYLVAVGRFFNHSVLTPKSEVEFSTPVVRPDWETTSVLFSTNVPTRGDVGIAVLEGGKRVATGRKLAPPAE